MKKETRIIIPLLFIFFVIIMFSPASATTITINDILSETNVTVPIMINNVEDVATATINLSYDPSVIVVIAAENSNFSSFFPNLNYKDNGWVKMAAYNFRSGVSGNVKFAELTIAPRGSYGQSSKLDIEVVTLSDGDDKPIDAEVKSGFFYIGKKNDFQPSPEPSPSPTPTSTPSVEDTTIPASPAPSPSPTPSTNETIPPSPSPSLLPALEQTPAIMTVHVQVGTVTVEKGKTANTSIMIKGIGEKGLSCARITLNYDSSVVKVENAGECDFDGFVWNVPSKGCLEMLAMGAEGLEGDIKFAEIRLRAVGKVNKNSELSLEIKELEDNAGYSVHFERENGFFSIKSGEKTEAEEPSRLIPTLSMLEIIALVTGTYFIIRMRRRRK